MTRTRPRAPWANRTPPVTAHVGAPLRLGIDIGRVIIEPGDGDQDTSFLGGSDEDAMRTPPSHGALETIAELVQAFEARVWLVSKCGPRIQDRTRMWLAHWRFHERTGLPRHQLRFCRKRPEKAPICAELGLQAFIDDRPDVLAPMAGIVAWRYLYGPQRRPAPAELVWVPDWAAVRAELLPLAREGAATRDRAAR